MHPLLWIAAGAQLPQPTSSIQHVPAIKPDAGSTKQGNKQTAPGPPPRKLVWPLRGCLLEIETRNEMTPAASAHLAAARLREGEHRPIALPHALQRRADRSIGKPGAVRRHPKCLNWFARLLTERFTHSTHRRGVKRGGAAAAITPEVSSLAQGKGSGKWAIRLAFHDV